MRPVTASSPSTERYVVSSAAARRAAPATTTPASGTSARCRARCNTVAGMEIILIPGLWLDGSSWDRVVPALERAGHRTYPLTLPGMESKDADRSVITLRDHVNAVVGV